MGVDTRVQIPPYVRFEDVAKLVAKYCGDPALQKQSHRETTVDFDKPAGPQNRWYHSYYDQVKTTSVVSLLHFQYQAFGEIPKLMSFHFDTDNHENRFLGYKIITARANPLNVAICKKIVDHFGGYIQYADSSDDYDVRITDKKAVFKKEDWVDEDPDVVYYRLVNSIDQVQPMTIAQLDWGIANASYDIEEEEHRIAKDWINVYQDKIMLEKRLDLKTPPNLSQNKAEKFKI